jgi:ankyrin repeat protein
MTRTLTVVIHGFDFDRWAQLLTASFDFPRFGYVAYSPLLVAIDLGRDSIVHLLLSHGVSPAASVDSEGTSSLMKAFSVGHRGIIDAILNHGSNVNAINAHGTTVLQYCLVSSPFSSPSSSSSLSSTTSSTASPAILEAAMMNHKCDLESVLTLDRLFTNLQGSNDDTNYIHALLERQSDPNISDSNGNSPLHWAVSETHVRVTIRGQPRCLRFDSLSSWHRTPSDSVPRLVSTLISYHAKVNVCNRLGQTPLHLALFHGHATAAKILLQHGAHPLIVDQYVFISR